MDARSRLQTRFPDPGFGPFPGEALQREINREAANDVFQTVAGQLCIIAGVVLAMGTTGLMFWQQISAYDRALALCAGV